MKLTRDQMEFEIVDCYEEQFGGRMTTDEVYIIVDFIDKELKKEQEIGK